MSNIFLYSSQSFSLFCIILCYFLFIILGLYCLHFHNLLNFEHLVFAVLDVFFYYNKDAWRNQNKAINKENIINK